MGAGRRHQRRAPCWSGLIAITNQLRVANGLATLNTSGPTQAQTLLYSIDAADFHDVASGSNGGFTAALGYDEVTGLGSPVANQLVPDVALYSTGTIASAVTTTTFAASSPTYGQSVTLAATVSDTNVGVSPPTGTVTFMEGTTTLGTATLTRGMALFSTSALVDAGAYQVTATYGGEGTTYTGSASSVLTVTVAPATLTITATNKSMTYGGSLPRLSCTYSGFEHGDTSASLTTQPTLSTTAAVGSPVSGSPYTITASGAVDPNYVFVYVSGTLTVTAASLTITANNQTKVYGAAVPTLTASYTGFVNGDTAASLTTQPTLTTTAAAGSPVSGSPYTITASGAVDTNYSFTYKSGTLTVTAAPLTITANNQTKVYGAALPTLTAGYTGFVNGDTSSKLTTQPKLSTTATAASPVSGSPYTITVSGAADSNYTISYVAGALTVTTAPLTITASNKSMVYGGTLPALTASYTGFVNGDTSASLTLQPTLSTTATAGSHVSGSPYTITASGAADSNYTISYVAGALTVTPAPLTIAAGNKGMTYGGAQPALTASYTGLVNGDTSAAISGLVLSTVPATSGAGSYPITASGAVDPDYSISYVPGTLTIGQAPLTITANDQTMTYGGGLPTLTASYTGLVNGDTSAAISGLTFSTAPATSSVGSYPITASGAADPNYSISYVSGTLTIGQAPLTITANNQGMTYGGGVPTLTAGFAGLVNGDTSAAISGLTLSTAPATSSVGSYPITASGAADPDYSISYVSGTLTIGQAPLTITADDQR